MKTYGVSLPISGTVYIEVEAEDEDDAIEKALISDQCVLDNIETWEAHRQITQGNFFYGTRNEAEAEPVDDGGEE
jgi:nicotinate-nucleotide pyrophosphorylase